MSLSARAIGGFAWGYGAFASEHILNLLSTAILARLLFPEDFGVLAFALLVIAAVDTFRDFGIKDALIYRSDRPNDMARTAMTMSLAIGLLQFAFVMLAAPLATRVIEDEQLVSLIRVLSFVFLVNALGAVPDALLQKRLLFGRRYMADLAGAFVKATVIIGLALTGFGLWSVAIGQLAGALVRTVVRLLSVEWLLILHCDRNCARALWQFGRHILLVSVISLLSMRADQLAVTLLLGPASLAYYYIAARLPELVIDSFSIVLTRVLFPVYATIQNERERLVTGFFMATRFTALALVPITIGLVAVAPELIEIVFGAKWQPSVPILQVLALSALVGSLAWSAGDVFKAVGRPELQTLTALVHCVVAVPLVFLLTWLSERPVVAAFGCLAAMTIWTALQLGLVARLLRISVLTIFKLYRASMAGGVAVLASVLLVRSVLAHSHPWLVLAGSVAVGVAAYAPLVWMLERTALQRLAAGLLGLFAGAAPAQAGLPRASK
jgi:lipopolysaccharide exporter